MKQADQLLPWTLSFRARAKRFDFDFKFKYSKILPICKLLRLSIRFNLRPFTLEFESKPGSAFSLKRKLSELKLLQKLRCLRRRRSGNKGTVKTWLDRKVPSILQLSLHFFNVDFILNRDIFKKIWGFCLKNNLFGRRESRDWLWILVSALAACFVIVQLSFYFRARFLWNCFWMGWNYFVPSGFLHHFFKV